MYEINFTGESLFVQMFCIIYKLWKYNVKKLNITLKLPSNTFFFSIPLSGVTTFFCICKTLLLNLPFFNYMVELLDI